ncbi:MAG: hypothetical protein FWE53_02320 [Firmicutes bacterium]|nr:hypothetical protein [Bacillota bacterium]
MDDWAEKKRRILDKYYRSAKLLDVETGEFGIASDDKTVVGTYGLSRCIATVVVAEAAGKLHRFVSHAAPFSVSFYLHRHMDGLKNLLTDIEKGGAPAVIKEVKLVSSSSMRDKNNMNEFEAGLLDSLTGILQPYRDQGQVFCATFEPGTFVKVLPNGKIILSTVQQTIDTLQPEQRQNLHPGLLRSGKTTPTPIL